MGQIVVFGAAKTFLCVYLNKNPPKLSEMIYIVFSILGLYLVSLPIRIRMKGEADFDAGHGNISFTVFYLPIFRVSGLLETRSFLHLDFIIMQQKKRRELSIDVNRKTLADFIQIIKNIDLSFLSNLDVKNIFLSVRYGSDDAFATSMYLGLAKIIFYSLTSAIKSNQHAEVSEEFVPVYNMRTFNLKIYSIFSLSVADIIYGYLAGKIKKFRQKRQTFAKNSEGTANSKNNPQRSKI